ncbi:MAG: NAD/NADP octopine/nopaline dehydrogenase family protein [Thermodesulfobacteriota bacterium]
MQKEQIVIIGGGNGALAFAAYFGLQGHPVRLWEFPEFRAGIARVYERQSLKVSGVITGEIPVCYYDRIEDALWEATTVMIVIPAFAHARIAEEIAPYLREETVIILNPGRTGGAFEVAKILGEKGIKITIAETQTLLFACRRKEEREVKISGIKSFLKIGFFPAVRTEALLVRLKAIIPPLRAVPDVLTTSFGNIGAMFHPASALFNVGLLESARNYDYYMETMTPTIVRVIEQADQERISIARKAGAEAFSVQAWLQESYALNMDSLYGMLHANAAYQGVTGPGNIQTRYITEDVPTGLVPMEAFGRLYDIPTPTITNLIDTAQTLLQRDFRRDGRNMERMGLADLRPDEIAEYVRTGTK